MLASLSRTLAKAPVQSIFDWNGFTAAIGFTGFEDSGASGLKVAQKHEINQTMLSLALPRASVPFFVKEAHYRLLDGNTAFSTHLIELSCAFNIPHNPLVSGIR